MIKNFGDHAANERTFLAWVRTAIAVMAFGFLASDDAAMCTANNYMVEAGSI